MLIQDWLLGSVNDYFSQSWYDWLPKSNNVDILGLTNQFRLKSFSAWHVKSSAVNFHTRRYILKRGILENNLDVIKDALDYGIDINEPIDAKYGFTPLSLAAMLNRTAILQYLYLRGADVNKLDQTGNTPLMQAVKNWNFDCIKLLVETCYSDITIKDQWGQNAIDKANFKKLMAIETYLQDKQETVLKNKEIYNKAFQLESQEDISQINDKNIIQPYKSKEKVKKQTKPSKKELDALQKQVQYKQFPKFQIEFGFEQLFKDQAGEKLIQNKKIFLPESIRYPFNNFKGTYRVSFLNIKSLDDALYDLNKK